MEETHRISATLTPAVLAQLDTYARAQRWSRSTAAAVLIERALKDQADEDTPAEGRR